MARCRLWHLFVLAGLALGNLDIALGKGHIIGKDLFDSFSTLQSDAHAANREHNHAHRTGVRLTPHGNKLATKARRGRKLDIVIVLYDGWADKGTVSLLQDFLEVPKVRSLDPQLYLYCQNGSVHDSRLHTTLAPLLKRSELVLLDSLKRGGQVYLQHIVSHYNELPKHTIFSHSEEDQTASGAAIGRIKALFVSETGILALSALSIAPCINDSTGGKQAVETPSITPAVAFQTKARFVGGYCSPEDLTAFFDGSFLLSSKRIKTKAQKFYTELLKLSELPDELNGNAETSAVDASSRLTEALDRAWSLLFDCQNTAADFLAKCRACDAAGWRTCAADACQCFDRPERKQKASILARLKALSSKFRG